MKRVLVFLLSVSLFTVISTPLHAYDGKAGPPGIVQLKDFVPAVAITTITDFQIHSVTLLTQDAKELDTGPNYQHDSYNVVNNDLTLKPFTKGSRHYNDLRPPDPAKGFKQLMIPPSNPANYRGRPGSVAWSVI